MSNPSPNSLRDIAATLRIVPATDGNFKSALESASLEEVAEAYDAAFHAGQKTRFNALRVELNRRYDEAGSSTKAETWEQYEKSQADNAARRQVDEDVMRRAAEGSPQAMAYCHQHNLDFKRFMAAEAVAKLADAPDTGAVTAGADHPETTEKLEVQVLPASPAKKKKGVRTITLSELNIMSAEPAPEGDEWANARKYAQMAEGGTQVVIVAQIMCGFELIELQKRVGLGRGGDRKSKPNDSVLTWPEMVKQQIGRSDDTARNWMNMAKAVAPRLKKLEGPWEAPALLALPPSEWPEGAREAVSTTIKNVCSGETQAEWMAELGLVKRGDGRAKNPGGFRPNALILRAWLKAEYPDRPELLDIDVFADLPPEIQKRFREEGERYEKRLTAEERAEMEREASAMDWLERAPGLLTTGMVDGLEDYASTEQLKALADLLSDYRAQVAKKLASRSLTSAPKALPSAA